MTVLETLSPTDPTAALHLPTTAFSLSGVTVSYGGKRALDSIDLEIKAGERIALIGSSGAGKTTLLRVLAGAVAPTSGTVAFGGTAIGQMTSVERRRFQTGIGFVHQDHALVPSLRALNNVVAGRLGARGFWSGLRSVIWPSRRESEAVHEVLERVGISDSLYQRTDRLSGGERQRVAIARALYQEPSVLLADEPVASVDPTRARGIVELLVQLSVERSIPLVTSLHDVDLARSHFDRLIGLKHGRVVLDTHPSGAAEGDEGIDLEDDALEALYAGDR